MGYRCFAAGDSHNDIQMFEVAEKGFFLSARDKISSQYSEIQSFNDYGKLKDAICKNSIFVK